ncbi:MAG: hypothetical protein K9M98_15720 [Cephaloticoccus sp.]|nr:hypothetical protein [Cephaloticoccus sp.]MCF7761950.1 hypothetical protein [Cephaloticoccus sp.]
MDETIKTFLQQTPPRHVTGAIMGLVKLQKRSQSQLMLGLRVTGLVIMGVLLAIAKLPAAYEDWSLDQSPSVEVPAQITGVGALAGIDDHPSREAVYFDYPLPDGNVGRARNIAPNRMFRKGQTALADMLRAKPEIVRLRGAQRSSQGSSILLMVPAFLVLLPVGWWASYRVVFREEKWWLRHAHWVEAKVVYEPEGKSTQLESYSYYRRGCEVEAHYDFEVRSEVYTMYLPTAEAEALAEKGSMPLLVLPTGKEYFEGGRTKSRRVARPEYLFRAR